jgi:hypothetical protein
MFRIAGSSFGLPVGGVAAHTLLMRNTRQHGVTQPTREQ